MHTNKKRALLSPNKIMKKAILISLLVISQSYFSQEKIIGSAIYSVKSIDNPNSQIEKKMLETYPNLNLIIENLEFSLIFSQTSSIFKSVDKMSIDENAYKIALAKIDFGGAIYIEKDTIFTDVLNIFNGRQSLLKSELNKNWTILNETKTIDSLFCYKAIKNDKTKNQFGEFDNKITAWFCPKIPFSFGPLNSGGLPGLIIELHTKRAVFGLKSYNLANADKHFEPLEKKNVITEEDLIKAYNESIKESKK